MANQNFRVKNGLEVGTGVTISGGIITATSFSGSFSGNATGLSGTPNITVGFITASGASISGNISVAGTVTYEDVTNVDSIGVITARSGIVVSSGSSIGIGTTNPTAKIHVSSGDIRVDGTNPQLFLKETDITNTPEWGLTADSGNIALRLNNTAPYALRVTTNAANNAIDRLELTHTGSYPVLIGTATSTGTANQTLQVHSGGAYVSGSIGVGNTNPGAKLDVTGDIRLSAADAEIEFNTGGARLKGRTNALSIHTGGGLDTETSEQVRINTTGVGIGTTNPTSKLHVVGNINSTTDITINGTSVLTTASADAVALAIALG